MNNSRTVIAFTSATLLVLVLAGCSVSDRSPPVDSSRTAVPTMTPAGGTDPGGGPPPPNSALDGSLRDAKYCEVIASVEVDGTVTSSIYNTFGHSKCTDAEWHALTERIVNEQFGSQSAQLNGPRHWVFDSVAQPGDLSSNPGTYQFAGVTGATFTFYGLETGLSVELQTAAGQPVSGEYPPYTVEEFSRNAVWTYQAGSRVYELTDPAGAAYVMESYSQQIETSLSYENLAGLKVLLTLPPGWSYSSRQLSKDLVLGNGGTAYLLHDNLDNAYQRNTTGSD